MILTYSGMRIFLRFNRYMVECEYYNVSCANLYKWVLIDTWWNVNLLYLRTLPESDTRFNRYMVECESGLRIYEPENLSGFNRYMVECE